MIFYQKVVSLKKLVTRTITQFMRRRFCVRFVIWPSDDKQDQRLQFCNILRFIYRPKLLCIRRFQFVEKTQLSGNRDIRSCFLGFSSSHSLLFVMSILFFIAVYIGSRKARDLARVIKRTKKKNLNQSLLKYP